MTLWILLTILYLFLIAAAKLLDCRRRGAPPQFHFHELTREYAFLWKPTLALFSIFFIACIALLRANFNYVDDMGRVALGYQDWSDQFSRYASDFLSQIFHGDSYLADNSPLNQILALLLMAFSGTMMVYLISGRREIHAWGVIGAIPLCLFPYFLECISYKYDSIYMALSVFAAVFPLMLYRRQSRAVYVLSVALCSFFICTSYQCSLGIFPQLVILLALRQWNSGRSLQQIGRFILHSVIGYFAGLLPFFLFVMKPVTMESSGYVSNQLPSLGRLFPTIFENYRKYLQYAREDVRLEWLILSLIILITFLFLMVRDSKRPKGIALLVTLAALSVMALLSFGLYPALESPLFAPRSMYGIGVFLACICISVTTARRVAPLKLACLGLVWVFIVFAFIYGNALFAQREYTDFRVQMVIHDLNDLEICKNDEQKTVEISGQSGFSPILENAIQEYRILNHLVPRSAFCEGWYHGFIGFYNYYGLKNIVQGNLYPEESSHNLPILKDTMYHTIRGEGNYILIELK